MEAGTSRTAADEATSAPAPHRRAIIGSPSSFWLHSTSAGFDLTHPSSPTAAPITPRLTLKTTTTPVTLDPGKSALVIIDMQNFFLCPSFGRARGPGHAALDQLMRYAIPAARRAKMQIVWLNWGLTETEIAEMPPAVKRAFGFEGVSEDGAGVAVDKNGSPRHLGGDKTLENGKDGRIYKGLGAECGVLTLEDGKKVDGGRLLMRDSWNAALFPPLDMAYEEGKGIKEKPDVWIHKNRMSGMWGATTECQDFLEQHGIKTLLFTGVNTDQCVSGTLTNSFSKGYDTILLKDGCGTTSPEFAQQAIEFNAAKTWGFLATCEDLAKGVEAMTAVNGA